MSIIIRIQINNKEIRCYSVQRITNTDTLRPTGKISKYKVSDCYSRKLIGFVTHNYDDIPEKLTIKAMKLIK
jgi:hypothetical protein